MKTIIYRSAILTFLAFAGLTFVFARYSYPLFTQDSGCFVPVAYFIKHAHQLINPIYDANIDVVTHKFIFYPPLFAYVTAGLAYLVPQGWDTWYTALTILDTLAMATLLYAIYHDVKQRNMGSSKWLYVFAPLLVVTIFSFQGIITGRPEILCRLFISLFILNNLRPDKKSMHFINGLLIGLNAITSPVSTFYLAAIAGFMLAYHQNFKLKPILQTLTGMLPVLLIFALLYPYPLGAMLKAILIHSRNSVFHYEGREYAEIFIRKHVTAALTPLSIVPFIICFLHVAYKVLKGKRYLAGAFLLLLLLFVYYFTFKDIVPAYNLYVLSPVVCFLLPHIFTGDWGLFNPGMLKLVQPLLIVVMFINCTGLLRKAASLPAAQDKYVSAADFRKTFINTLAHTKPHKKILISVSLWPYCLDKANRILQYRSFGVQDTMLRDTSVQYLMVQQNSSGLGKPLVIPHFQLIENQFITGGKKAAGILLFNTYPGYQVVIYERR